MSDGRRGGDSDSSQKILAAMWKFIGNSGYSSVLLRKDRFCKIFYHDQSTVDKAINSPRFVNLDVVDSDLYEVKSLKKTCHIRFTGSNGDVCLLLGKIKDVGICL